MPDGRVMKNILDISRCRASAMLIPRLHGMADLMADWLAIVSRSPSRVQSSMLRMHKHMVRTQAH